MANHGFCPPRTLAILDKVTFIGKKQINNRTRMVDTFQYIVCQNCFLKK
jgi:hypothetical protein